MLPKVIDLFSGCGGLALGFQKAGFEIVAGIELMPEACKTIAYNMSWRYGKENVHIQGDITQIDEKIFADKVGKEGVIVIGGPPCQAYSMAGRGKLRSLGDDRINTSDARGYLYQDFLRFSINLNARAVVMENVPESTTFGEENIPEKVCCILEENGYKAYWTILNAADYGVPQIRERVFIIGIKEEEKKQIKLPVPTHKNPNDVLTQYEKRKVSFNKNRYYKEAIKSDFSLNDWNTIKDAFSDLPELFPSVTSKYKLLSLNVQMPYKCEAKTDYQSQMRSWFGKEEKGVTANAFRRNKRDFPIFDKMMQGDNFIDACIIADNIFKEEVKILGYQDETPQYQKLHDLIVPKSNRLKFDNKWKKLSEDKPSHTLVAHLEKDTYSHIHPWEPRGISVREAARIQSFPDDFYFDCSMGNAFKQIGNAVPPLLSVGVAKTIYNVFKE